MQPCAGDLWLCVSEVSAPDAAGRVETLRAGRFVSILREASRADAQRAGHAASQMVWECWTAKGIVYVLNDDFVRRMKRL